MHNPDKPFSDRKPIQLEELERKNVFSVPDTYFDTLPTIIQARTVKSASKSQVAWLPLSRIAGLASLVLLVLAGWWWSNAPTNQPLNQPQTLTSVSNDEIIEYLQTTDLSQQEVMEMASEANIDLDQKTLRQLDVSNETILEAIDPQEVEELI